MLGALRGLSFDESFAGSGLQRIRSRQNVTTTVEVKGRQFDIPIISSNMDTITEVGMANAMAELGGMAILHRFCTIEQNIAMFKEMKIRQKVGISIGLGKEGLERAEALASVGAEIVCVDVAHGHCKEVNRTVRDLRDEYGDNILIIAGNVASYAGADYLAAAGTDMIKVGIGAGSVCTTRIKSGFGVPQLSAIQDCRRVDRVMISDGGIKCPADAVKALAAGADFVMLGGLLAGTDETPGEISEKTLNGQPVKIKRFRGMASREAQEDFMGYMAEWKTAEGISTEVPCRGPMRDVIRDVMGGIRSGMTYCGAATIQDLQRKAQFIEITAAARYEGTPHALDRFGLQENGSSGKDD